MLKIFLLLSLSFVFLHIAFAQQEPGDAHQFHSWFYYIGDHKVSKRWGIHPEVQFRRTGFGTQPQQFLLRSAVNYHPTDRLMISQGYVYSREYPYGIFPADFEFSEHRIYQQAEYEHNLAHMEIMHRARLEQRWLEDIEGVPDPDSEGGLRPESRGWEYRNRARYQLSAHFPLQGKEIDDNEFFLYASNEIFFSFGRNVESNGLDQNRFQIGIGYQVGGFGRIETGYLYQYIIDPGTRDVENNHTFILAWVSRFDFR